MALSPQVVKLVEQVLTKDLKGKDIKVASLGYPDILLPLDSFSFKDKLEPHPDSESITNFHGRGSFVIPTAESFFKALGATLEVLDVKAWRGDEIIVDLNYDANPKETYDLLLDNGTLEHCFNVPMAIWNIRGFVKPGGYVIHWNPHHMPNHGFYNFSSTFFWDWYEANGGKVVDQTLWNFETNDGKTQEVGYMVPNTKRFNFPSYNNSLLTLVKIESERSEKPVFPVQTKYRKMGLNDA